MTKALLIFLTILITNGVFGQTEKTGVNLNDNEKLQGPHKIEQSPQYVILVDTMSIKPEKFAMQYIDSEWIESVSVLKDDLAKRMYGNKNGAIIITTKKQYRDEVLMVIENILPK